MRAGYDITSMVHTYLSSTLCALKVPGYGAGFWPQSDPWTPSSMWEWCSELQAEPFVVFFQLLKTWYGVRSGSNINAPPHIPNIHAVCTQSTWLLCCMLAPASFTDLSFRMGIGFWGWSRAIHCVYQCLETWYEVGSGDDNTSMVHTHLHSTLYVLKVKTIGHWTDFWLQPDPRIASYRMGMMFWGWSRAIHYIWWQCLEIWYGMGSG